MWLSSNQYKYPKGERVRVGYQRPGSDDALFILTEKEATGTFFLYEVKDGALVKLGKASSPPELEKKFSVFERLKAET